nr:hypothetical protein [Orrella marina]
METAIQWVDPDKPLPPAHTALEDPPGLVAAGLDLSIWRLEQAYSEGMFPWFNPGSLSSGGARIPVQFSTVKNCTCPAQ